MTDEPQDRPPLPGRVRETRSLQPAPPDQNRLPCLPYLQRHPHLKPPRRPWRRSIRRRLSEV
jgi:hypothetical protein